MTSKSRGHCDNIKVFNQGKSNQIREKSGNLIAKNVWPPWPGTTWDLYLSKKCPSKTDQSEQMNKSAGHMSDNTVNVLKFRTSNCLTK